MYHIQTCLYDVCMCMYFFAHTYKISQLLCCLYVLKDTYTYKHHDAGSLMGGVRAAADQLLFEQDGEGLVDGDVGIHVHGGGLCSRVASVYQ